MKLVFEKKPLLGFIRVFTHADIYKTKPIHFLQEKDRVRVFISTAREDSAVKDKEYNPFFISRSFEIESGEHIHTGIAVENAEHLEELLSETDAEEIIINCDTGRETKTTAEIAVQNDDAYELLDTCTAYVTDGDYPDISSLTEYNDKMNVYYGDGQIVHAQVAGEMYATLEMYEPGDCQELYTMLNTLSRKYSPEFKKGENFMVKARQEQKKQAAENAVENNEESTDKETEKKEKQSKEIRKSDKNTKKTEQKDAVQESIASQNMGSGSKEIDKKVNKVKTTSDNTDKKQKKNKKKRTKEEIERDNFDWCVEFLDERGYDVVKREISVKDALGLMEKYVEVIRAEIHKPLDKEDLLEQLQTYLTQEES